MTWPGQQGCQEDSAVGDRRGWLDKQVAAVVPIFLQHCSPVTSRGHKHATAVHSCPHSGCGPRRSGPDQLSHQLSGPGWVQCSRECVSSLGAAMHCAPPHAELLFLGPKKGSNLGALTTDVYCPPPEAGIFLQSLSPWLADSFFFL